MEPACLGSATQDTSTNGKLNVAEITKNMKQTVRDSDAEAMGTTSLRDMLEDLKKKDNSKGMKNHKIEQDKSEMSKVHAEIARINAIDMKLKKSNVTKDLDNNKVNVMQGELRSLRQVTTDLAI